MNNKIIPTAKPIIGEDEISEVVKVLKSGELSQGKWVEDFEKEFANFTHTKFAIATSNGTTALHLSLLVLGIKEGDEVITTPFTFIASVNAILYVGAKPIFVDIDPKTFNINPDLIEEKITSKTRAILPVHLFGFPADMAKILKIAKKHNLLILEDAAQAHGSKIDNQVVGSFGELAAFSFYPTKNITTGEGGMITTNNENLTRRLRMLRNHGMEKRYHHDVLGFNFRMTNIAAAIGIRQLKKINDFNKKRIENAKFLTEGLSNINAIQTPFVPQNFTHVFHQYTVLVKDGKGKRDKLAEYLNKNGVATMVYYPIPVHKQKFMEKMFPKLHLRNAEEVADQALSLPVHPSVTREDLEKIISCTKVFFRQLNENV